MNGVIGKLFEQCPLKLPAPCKALAWLNEGETDTMKAPYRYLTSTTTTLTAIVLYVGIRNIM